MHSAEYPVNVPTSTARLAPIAVTSSCMNAPCSGEICIIERSGTRALVSSMSHRWTSSGGVPCPTM